MTADGLTPIAIIGIGCRFPGDATDPEKLWTLLVEGRNCWTEVPADRFNDSAFNNPNADAPGSHNHRGGHFLTQDIATFEADFFRISATEAQAMDPQQRILLETTYEAFESCGSSLDSVRGSKTAVYVAIFSRDYDRNIYKDTDDIPKYHTTGTGEAILANRISYVFDLKGPSMTLDTGCSGSLVALHQACQSLRTREVDTAVAGGVNLILSPDQMIGMTNLHMLNKDGKSYSFDSRGSGYGRGEGSATVIVRRLDDAIRCGDPIRAVICNTAVNQDGKTSGITFPSQEAQENLQRSIYRDVGIDPCTVGYVEAHGTGTAAGDLAEIGAIRDVFCNNRKSPLHVGSIKSNIGHLESASGLAGLVKTVLVLEKGSIPPNANFEAAKAELNLDNHELIIPNKFEPFGNYPIRRASVNSFGYGGTNAHAILEEAPDLKPRTPRKIVKADSALNDAHMSLLMEENSPKLLVLSARTRISLVAAVRNLSDWVSTREGAMDIENLAYTLSLGRTILHWRFAFVAKHRQDIMHATQDVEMNESLQKASLDTRVVFIFTGQGAQWYAMGRDLILTCSQFRNSLSKSDAILRDLGASWNLIDELLLGEFQSRIDQSSFAQPACTAIQIALIDLLENIGVHPHTVLGHSSGEIAAAYAAGILSQAAAIRVAYHRSFVSDHPNRSRSPKGAMLAIGLSEEETLGYIDHLGYGDICVACVNSPASTTVSGNEASVLELHKKLRSSSVFSKRLNVDTAYHSYHMREASTQYLNHLHGLEVAKPRKPIKFISTVTASEKDFGFGPEYWVDNLVSKVRFSDAILRYSQIEQGNDKRFAGHAKQIMIEIGPHPTLKGPIRQTIQGTTSAFNYEYFPSLARGTSATLAFLGLTGKLFEHGISVNFERIHSISSNKSDRVIMHNLPSYPWDHSRRYWSESRLSKQHRFREHASHDLLGTRIASSTSIEPHWRHLVGIENLPWLQEHIVDNLIIFPGAGYMCMVIEAARQLLIDPALSEVCEVELRAIYFLRALVVPPAPAKVELHLSLVKPLHPFGNDASLCREFRISALSSEGIWNEHCGGLVKVHHLDLPADRPISFRKSKIGHIREKILSTIHAGQTTTLDPHRLYQDLESNGNYYGPHFAAIKEAYMDNKTRLITKVEIPNVSRIMPAQYLRPHLIHPTTLDALMHSTLPLYMAQKGPGSVMPTAIKEFRVSSAIESTPCKQLLAETMLMPDGLVTAKADIVVFDSHSSAKPVMQISGVELRGFPRKPEDASDLGRARDISFQMKWDIDANFLLPSVFASAKSATGAISPAVKVRLLNQGASVYINRSLAELKIRRQRASKPHLTRLIEWMEGHRILSKDECSLASVGELNDDSLLEQLQYHGVEGHMLSRVGQNLTSILTGDIEPLTLMLEDNLLYKFYADDSSSRCYAHLSRFLKYFCFKRPRLRILEIGAGTGSTTLPTLKALSAEGVVHIDHYDFTDISTGFFDKARDLLTQWAPFITFEKLDVSRYPQDQGFKLHSYDLVLAANVLHATSSIERTLANVCSLLKPQGKLVLIELTQLQPFLGTIFGTLPGWWQSVHDERQDSPILTRNQWHDALSSCGFNGLDLAIDDIVGPAQTSTFMVSTATIADYHSLRRSINIVADEDRSDTTRLLAGTIRSEFESHGLEVSIVSWESNHLMNDVINVVIDDSSCPLLINPTSARFNQVINLVASGRYVFWISGHANTGSYTNPEAGLVTGLARTAHTENQVLRLVTLDIQQRLDGCMSRLLSVVYDLLFYSFHPSLDDTLLREREYVYRDGEVLIPRVVPYDNLNQWMRQSPSTAVGSLSFPDDDTLESQLDAYAVEIDIKAYGVNSKEGLFALNQKRQAQSSMAECAGVITSTGSKVSDLAVGHRVSAFGGTPYASRVRINERNAVRLPDSMPFTIGASIPVAFMTAYHCLVTLAKLKIGQSIMISAAIGAVEQAAILIAKHIGAIILAIVSSSSEQDLLVEKFDLSRAHIILSSTNPVAEDLIHITGKSGADVVLSCSPHLLTENDLACIAFGGTVFQTIDSRLSSELYLKAMPLDRNLTFKVVDLMAFVDHQPFEASSLLVKVMSLFESGVIQPEHSITVKPMAQIEDALNALQSGKQIEKIVLESGQGSMVRTEGDQRIPKSLVSNATYVVAGGLGDIGNRLTELMVRRGARHIVVLSRRSLKAGEHRKVEDKARLISPEARFYWKTCDIANGVQVMECAASLLSSGLPPVKGIVQAAVVLQDCTLSKMTLEDFTIPLQSKLHGTRNLYAAFEKLPLDFFIILSSVSGTSGTGGQANYAAGNAFQDAFANSRPTEKFPCISIDIGLIENANINNSVRVKNLARHGVTPMTVGELLSLLEFAMTSQTTWDQCKQIVMGYSSQSLSQVTIPNATAKSPLFCHIQPSSVDEVSEPGRLTDKSLKLSISECSGIEEVHQNVTAAITRKLSSLVVSDDLLQKVDSSMTDLGLDSLITTELRNWIFSEFQAATQVSEILDQASIKSFASLVASRSAFVQDKIKQLSCDHDEDGGKPNMSIMDEGRTLTGDKTPFRGIVLPVLPLPDLRNTLSTYLESRKFFLSEEELAHTSNVIAQFLHDGEHGQELQGRLQARSRDPEIDNWLSEPYSKKIYLERRDPIHPTGTFYGGHLLTDVPHTQAERAAVLAAAAFEFKCLVELGTVERDYINDEPICMESLNWLFNAVREPRVGCDGMRRYPGHNYLIALRHGHIYKIQLENSSGNIPHSRLKAAFRHVLAKSEKRQPSLTTLTADERDSWARVRGNGKLTDDVNKVTINAIEAAAFVICLDDGEPSTASERCNQFFLGDPSNRWSDKNLQFVVCTNGVSAFVGEHAMLDGMSVRQFNRFITRAILHHKISEADGETSLCGENLVEELDFVIDPAIESRINRIQQQFREIYSPIEFVHHSIHILGNKFLRSHKCPAKAGYQVIIQLACLLYYGYQPESWETISMSRFHKGRVDWIQAIHPVMASFCATACDNTLPLVMQRKMFFDAVNTFVNTMSQVGRGHGFKAHMHALLAMVHDNEPVPALFKDRAWLDTTVSSVKTVKTDCLEGAMLQETAFLMAEPKCIFVHYEVEDDGCMFFIQTWPGRARAFCDALEAAAKTVKIILEAGE